MLLTNLTNFDIIKVQKREVKKTARCEEGCKAMILRSLTRPGAKIEFEKETGPMN